MIILDTNVISEPTRFSPNGSVTAWLDCQAPILTYTTSINLAELRTGIQIMPEGRKKTVLSERMRAFVAEYLHSRILPFDEDAARIYPLIVAQARHRGLAIGTPDAQIAAIAARQGYAVANRDTAPFIAAGVPVINPWQHAAS